MYSILLSKIENSEDLIAKRLKEIILKESKVLIFPWAFPKEISSEEFENNYFSVKGERYKKYLRGLEKFNIKKENCIICNPYKDSKTQLKKMIKQSDVLIFPGGNPEMFFQKVLHDTELIYDIKHFRGIIIGESAGAELQLKRYFITSTNNFYKYMAFYDGFGIINDSFLLDVHTKKEAKYILELQNIANSTNMLIYAICDDGAIVYDRTTKKIETYGQVEIIKPNNQII